MLALCLTALCLPASAHAAGTRERVGQTLTTWTTLQNADGSFPDYLHGNVSGRVGGYDEEVLGYALLENGLRTGDQAQIDGALRASAWAITEGPTTTAPDGRVRTSAFANAALAAAYRLARTRLGADARFRGLRARWENHLRQVTPARLGDGGFDNKSVVDAVGILELLGTGLRSAKPGAVLQRRGHWRRRASRLINRHMPKRARDFTSRVRGRKAVVLSDPPMNPIAYHALTLGYLARGIELLGERASPAARRLLVRMANGSLGITAPDGDLAYMGRSQEQAWALTFTAYGARVAARQRGARRGAFEALGRRALHRLAAHGGGPTGFAITPNLARNPPPGQFGLDSYASAAAYTGLSMIGALWAIERRPRRTHASRITADRDGAALLSSGRSLFATVRRGGSWYAVRTSPAAADLNGDWRMDFGPMAWKLRQADGSWTDALPLRPVSKGVASAGPVLIRGGRKAAPYGRALRIARRGVVLVRGRWQFSGRPDRNVRFRFTPRRRRLTLRFPVRGGDRIRYSVFVPRLAAPAARPSGFSSTRLKLRANAPAVVSARGSYASGAEHDLVRITAEYRIRRDQRLALVLSAP